MAIPSIAPYSIPQVWPEPQVTWDIDPARAAVLVHDMQQYFIEAYRADRDPIRTVLENIAAIIDHADRLGIPVFFSAQPPAQDSLRRGLLTDFWGPGMQSEDDAAIISELAPRSHHKVITKWRYSAFERTDFGETLSFAHRNQLLITGVYGHMGCKVTATDAFMNDIQPFLISDAIADFTAQDHQDTLDWVARRCGRVISTGAVLEALN